MIYKPDTAFVVTVRRSGADEPPPLPPEEAAGDIESTDVDVSAFGSESEPAPRLRRSMRFDDRYYADLRSAVWSLAKKLSDEVEAILFTRRAPASSRRRRYRTLAALLANFVRVQTCDPGRYLAVPLRHENYSKSSVASYHSMRQVLTGLEACGYVRVYECKRPLDPDAENLITRVEVLAPLRAEFTRYRLGPADVQCGKRRRLISLEVTTKERRKRIRAYKRRQIKAVVTALPWPPALRPEKRRMEANLRRINAALRSQFAALFIRDSDFQKLHKSMRDEARYVDFFARDLYRVFTDDPWKNGRFYGAWWINVPKQYRRHIRLSAPDANAPARTVELDYEGLHVAILYAEKGAACIGDPHTLYLDAPERSARIRPVAKKAWLTMLNSADSAEARSAIREWADKETFPKWHRKHGGPWPTAADAKLALMFPGCPPIKTLMADLQVRHAPISDSLNSGAGKRLMFKDSQLAEAILIRMLDEYGVIALPCHDSFIVPSRYAGALEDIMVDEFRRQCGAPITVAYPDDDAEPVAVETWYSADDARQLRELDYAYELEECSIYYALLDDWIARQPRVARPALGARKFADSDSAVQWAVQRITAIYAPKITGTPPPAESTIGARVESGAGSRGMHTVCNSGRTEG